MNIQNIVNTIVERKTTGVSTQDFTTILVLSSTLLGDAVQWFDPNDLSAIETAIGNNTSVAYKALSSIAQQNVKPALVGIARMNATTDTAVTTALNSITETGTKFFGIIETSRSVVVQKSVANWAQANDKLCVLSTAETANWTTTDAADTATITAHVKANALFNTLVISDKLAGTQALDAVTLAYLLSRPAGSITLAHKTFTGVKGSVFTSTEEKNIEDKYGSLYTDIGGSARLVFSNVGDGDYLDTVFFTYWLKARLNETIYNQLGSKGKITNNEEGHVEIVTATLPVWAEAEDNGAISEISYRDGVQVSGWKIDLPRVTSVADKVARVAKGFKGVAFYTSAVHTVELNINLSNE